MEKININYNNKNLILHVHSGGEVISDVIRKNKTFYEVEFLDYIRNNFPKQKNIIDIGSNIGNHALFFAEFIEYDKIYCFEPQIDNVNILRENMKDKQTEIYDIALSDVIGEKTLYNSQQGNSGGFSLECYDHPTSKSYKVLDSINVRTLDSYNFENISMIKIDVESHELPVLNGAKDTIIRNKPIIFLEDLSYDFPKMFEKNRFNQFFNDIGYKLQEGNILGSMMDLWVPIN